jgi:putative alpha-1,2-mannosidase
VYRSLLTPTLFNDHNGEYASFANNGTVAVVPEWMNGVYTDMSLWDVHRTNMPWLLLHDPMRYQDVVGSLMLFNRDGGYMPKWPFANGWTGCMIGAHANTVMADWVVKESGE